MSKLIAMVATAVVVGGVRTVIQPGQELPELHAHDAAELVASGAAQDTAATAAAEKAAAKEEAKSAAEFKAARQRVQAEKASTTPTEKTK
jgi:hypothetical protein